MGKRTNWNKDLTSIKSFFKYLLMTNSVDPVPATMLKHEFYDRYLEYCRYLEIDYFNQYAFENVIKSIGFQLKVEHDVVTKHSIVFWEISLELMRQVVAGFEDDFLYKTEIISLGGKKYNFTIKIKPFGEEKKPTIYPEVQAVLEKDRLDTMQQKELDKEPLTNQ